MRLLFDLIYCCSSSGLFVLIHQLITWSSLSSFPWSLFLVSCPSSLSFATDTGRGKQVNTIFYAFCSIGASDGAVVIAKPLFEIYFHYSIKRRVYPPIPKPVLTDKWLTSAVGSHNHVLKGHSTNAKFRLHYFQSCRITAQFTLNDLLSCDRESCGRCEFILHD